MAGATPVGLPGAEAGRSGHRRPRAMRALAPLGQRRPGRRQATRGGGGGGRVLDARNRLGAGLGLADSEPYGGPGPAAVARLVQVVVCIQTAVPTRSGPASDSELP